MLLSLLSSKDKTEIFFFFSHRTDLNLGGLESYQLLGDLL